MGVTISVPDALRQSVEAATGGRNTVLYDAKGYPSVMVVVPAFNLEDIDQSLGTGLHPAFRINGQDKSEIFVGKYQAIVHDGHALSLPGQDPRVSITFNTAVTTCAIKGPGWHMITNAEWAAVALWCWKNGFMPRGNTDWGRDHAQTYEVGRRVDGDAPGYTGGAGRGRILTGSGPVSWYHDNSPAGIADLTGNVWEWVAGLRTVDGEIQIIADNNAAATDADHSESSTLWRAILQDGSLVTPGSSGTLKWDIAGGNPVLATSVATTGTANTPYSSLTEAAGVTAPALLKVLGLHPHANDIERGNLFINNAGERLPRRGGYWNNGNSAGLFAAYVYYPRTNSFTSSGFRIAYAL